MAETLAREIEARDIEHIHNILASTFGQSDYISISRLGGMTNRTYKITRRDGHSYVVRIPGDGTEALINRAYEKTSTELAVKLGIDSDLLYFSETGEKVMSFIDGAQDVNEEMMHSEIILQKAAFVFRTLHTCGEDTEVPFDVDEMIELYLQVIKANKISVYEDFDEIRAIAMTTTSTTKVPCHNDSLMANWLLSSSGKLYLVDWEYAGMNDPMWDLACLSIEAQLDSTKEKFLLQSYLGRIATDVEQHNFQLAKLRVDLLWSLWGLARVPYDGDFMQKYADIRYERLRHNIEGLC